jgi:Flp pilus assembly pilin Flp
MVDRLNTLVLNLFSRLQLHREEGQGMVEYALIIAVIAVGGIAAWKFLGSNLTTKASNIGNSISTAGP